MDENNDELESEGKGELPEENEGDGRVESLSQSKDGKVENVESIVQSRDGKAEDAGSLGHSKDASDDKKAENIQKGRGPPKRKRNYKNPKTSGLAKLSGGFKGFGTRVKKLWEVWGRFRTKNMQDPNPSATEKTLGVPGFEEISCIEAEVPDIMMTDKDRVRTSCKECMQETPTFPTKDQIKAKLIAADKYYGVESEKIKMEQSETILEHEADYYDDGMVVRPSWRFILERPLVEQYVLMTNYIRKVSVLSELKEDKHLENYVEEKYSFNDAEYKKFEQKFIKEKQELLKSMQKPKTQEMAVQTSYEPKQHSGEELKESVSEISLYPESEESTNSPEASAVTIVTSRDYTSPLQSDFDGRTTDKSASYKCGNWWESETTCQPSESFQTSYDSINKNTSSGSDGQYIPIHSNCGKTTLRPACRAFSNESDSQITSRSHSVEPATHRKPKESKKVSFSPVVTYYRGPNKNGSICVPNDEEPKTETNQTEPHQLGITANPLLDIQVTDNPPEDQITDKNHGSQEKILISAAAEKPKNFNKKDTLGNILQDKKPGQIVSVSLPADWSENTILRNNQKMNVIISRPPTMKQLAKKRISFQDYDELPDVEHSNLQVSTAQDRTDVNIQTQTPVAPNWRPADKGLENKHRESSTKHSFDYQASCNPKQYKMQLADDNPCTAQMNNSTSLVPQLVPNTKILTAESNHMRWLRHEKTVNIGSESEETVDIQSSPPQLITARPASKTLRRVDQKCDHNMMKQASPSRPRVLDTAVQQDNFPNPNTQTQVPRMESIPKFEPRLKDSDDKYSKNVTHVNVLPSLSPDQIPANHIPRGPHSPQQQNTDTEGPSSSSNEHIKLKASPACFFKIATPTDLSKISVDDFYPDVPEIDAELSHISETAVPRVEIVFANKETAARCMKGAELSRVSGKEENTILQRSINTEDDCPIRLDPRNKNKTITASAGVRFKIDEGQNKSSNKKVSKPLTRNSSQQSSITQCVGKSSPTTKKSMGESEEKSITPKEAKMTICKPDFRSTDTEQVAIQGNEVKITATKLEEFEPKTIQSSAQPNTDDLRNEKGMVSRQKVNAPPVELMEIGPNVPISPDGISHHNPSKKDEETLSVKKLNVMNEIDSLLGENEKKGQVEKLQQLAKDDDDTGVIQDQLESLPIDPTDQVLPNRRTKLYMRTLSSLAEEVSSVMESTSSSTHEKLIDMPVMVRSVEELKTIFEKKLEVASISGESEMQVKDSRSDFKRYVGLSKEKQDNEEASQKLISIENSTPVDDVSKSTTKNQLQQKLDKKSSSESQEQRLNSQKEHNLLPAAGKADESNAIVMEYPKCGAREEGSQVRSEDGCQSANNEDKPPSAINGEESSAQQLSQIDVIRASAIYSNTSMYFSSSEDRVAKLSKARTVFQPLTMNDDLLTSSCSRDTEKIANENQEGSNPTQKSRRDPGSTQNLDPEVKQMQHQITTDLTLLEQGPKPKTNHEGDNFSIGQDSKQTPEIGKNLRKEKGETEETHTNVQGHSSGSTTNTNTGLDKAHPTDTKSRTHDTSNPSETKHWLMDVIPILSKNTRSHGCRPHKPICLKEVTEAEAVKYRQEAVKPVFRFLKRQREMEANKE